MTRTNAQVHLSLQTKLSLIVTLIMALALASNISIDYLNALNSTEEAGFKKLDTQFEIFEQFTERSTELFEQELNQIPIEHYLNKPEDSDHPKALSANPTIVKLRILDFNGRELRAWQATDAPKAPAVMQQQLINQVRMEPRPVSRIFCGTRCFQTSFTPVIADSGKPYIVNGLRDLSQVLYAFNAITGSEAALASSSSEIFIATNAANTAALIAELDNKTAFFHSGAPVYTNTSKGSTVAASRPLNDKLSHSPLQLAILFDDHDAQASILSSLKNSLVSAGVALLLTILMTFLALRRTLVKLVNLSNAIPMLSDSNYDRLRDSLGKYSKRSRFSDEIDQLNYTVLDVADALEEMESSVATHRQELLHTIAELKETQEFNDALVNDSPLVIVAFKLNGKLIQLNDYGRRLAGWQKSDVEKRSVSDLILPDPVGHTILDNLKPLISGRETRTQSEQLIRNQQGSVSYLTWIHAKVATRGEPMILSVGLDVTERRRTENRLRWLSKHDAITDLLNREAFHTEATQLIEQYRETHTIELMMFDIDKFSSYNDMYGFQHGDNMLRETARFIERLISCHTIIGRTGTNEFSALLIIDEEDTTTDEQDKLFRSDGHPLRFYSALDDDAIEVNVTAVVARHQEDGETVDDMLSNCAATLRALKPIDRGKVNYISAHFDNRAARQEKVQVHDSIVKALSDERFVLYFQPIYNLEKNRVTHCECLVRMLTEDDQILSPASFMDIAKASGLMPRIDYLVLKMALTQLNAWAENNIHLKLSVNITADTFESDRFINQLQQLLETTGARGSQLIFEVVETEAIKNLETAKVLCQKLDALDVQIAFDDFGIGFTSFEYLRDLPVDFIKIDQSFIRYIYKRKSDQLLVKSMVDMAQALGKLVVAEGVEDNVSADLLREMGVHYLQGYYISRPCKANELNLNYVLPAN